MGMAAVLLLSFLLLAAPAAAINILRRSLAAQTKGDLASITAGNPLVANAMNDRLKNLTDAFAQQMGKEFHYCIKDTYVRSFIHLPAPISMHLPIVFLFFLLYIHTYITGTTSGISPSISPLIPPSSPTACRPPMETYRSVCAPPLR
jgi:hypothetical protein